MKRMACLLLVMAMLCGVALADSIFGFSMRDYHGCASSFLPRLGYEIQWADFSENVGADCLELTYTNLVHENGVYVLADPVLSLNIIYNFVITSDNDELDHSVTEFSELVKSAAMCAWVADHASAEDFQQQLTAMLQAADDEFAALIDPMLHMDGDFGGTATNQGTLFGYPAAFDLQLDMQTFNCMLNVTITPPADVTL